MNLDDLDRALLDRIQRNFPIEPRPFEALARELGTDEATIMNQVRQLQSGGVVRQIGPVFDLHRLGYTSTLCAAKISADAIDNVASHINADPEVTHNYLRDAEFNIWFTLVAPSQERIDEILEEIRKLAGVEDVISLPADRTFKINVHFATGDAPVQDINKQEQKTGTDTLLGSFKRVSVPAFRDPPATITTFSDRDIALIRALQAPFPIVEQPWLEIAERAGMTEDEVITSVREWLGSGVIRRFGARVKHHAIGYTANGMSVWDVPADRVEFAGRYIASLPEVSHCYTRPRAPQWPYNLYAMIHGTHEEQVLALARQLAQRLNIQRWEVLFSTRELKKSAPVYFSELPNRGGSF